MISFFKRISAATAACIILFTHVYAQDIIPGAISKNIKKTQLTARVIPSNEYENRFGTSLNSVFLSNIYAIELSIKNDSSKELVFSTHNVLVKKATPLFTKKALRQHLSSDFTVGLMTLLFFPVGFIMLYQKEMLESLAPIIYAYGPGEHDVTIQPNQEFKTILFIEADREEEDGQNSSKHKKIEPLYFNVTVQLKDAAQWNLPFYTKYAREFDVQIPNYRQ